MNKNPISILRMTGLVVALGLAGAAWAQPAPQSSGSNDSTVSSATKSVGTAIDDGSITATIKTKLMADERTKAFDTNVDTNHGMVTLRGTAPNATAKAAAAELARETKGVKSVSNQLVVTPNRTDNPQTMSQKTEAAVRDAGH